MLIRLMASGVAALLVLAGCGSDASTSLDDDEQKAAQALSVEFQGEDPSDFTRDVGVCMGKRLVNDVGTDRLVEAGLLNQDLTVNADRSGIKDTGIAEEYADAILACQDVRGEIESRRDQFPQATDADIDAYVTCVEAIDDAVLRKAIVASAMRTTDPSAEQYAAKTRACTQELGQPAKE